MNACFQRNLSLVTGLRTEATTRQASAATKENVFKWVATRHPGSVRIWIKNKISIGEK